jgi:hypothetical protein
MKGKEWKSVAAVCVTLFFALVCCSRTSATTACREVKGWAERVRTESEYLGPDLTRSMRQAKDYKARVRIMISAKQSAYDRVKEVNSAFANKADKHELYRLAIQFAQAYELYLLRDIAFDQESLAQGSSQEPPNSLEDELRAVSVTRAAFDRAYTSNCSEAP